MALCAVGTAPNITAYLSRESVVQSVPTASPLTSCTRLSRSTRPLRPPASLLHNALFCEVVTSHCAKAPFVLPTASRPSGLQNWRYAKWPSLVLWLPCMVASVRCCAHSPGQWPTASHGQLPPYPPEGGRPEPALQCRVTAVVYCDCKKADRRNSPFSYLFHT